MLNLLYVEILGANYSHIRDTVHGIGYQVRSMWESSVEIVMFFERLTLFEAGPPLRKGEAHRLEMNECLMYLQNTYEPVHNKSSYADVVIQ